jgi:hypothetical protein
MDKSSLAPEEALERIFDVVRDWARKPENARHLISVLGLTVEYPRADPKIINPHVLVKSRSEEEFHAIFAMMTVAQLRTVMTNNKLGVTADFTGMNKPQLLDELYRRAHEKAAETTIR